MKTEIYIRTENQNFKEEPASIYVYDETGNCSDNVNECALNEASSNFGEDFEIEWIEYDHVDKKHIFHVSGVE